MLLATLVLFDGRKLIREIQAAHRKLFVWTANDKKSIGWCIERNVDGIVTDDVAAFLRICDEYDAGSVGRWPVKSLLMFLNISFFILIFSVVFRRRHGTCFEDMRSNKKIT